MLIALAETPPGVGEPLTWTEYIRTYLVSSLVLAFNVVATMRCNTWAQHAFNVSSLGATAYFLLLSMLITLALYVYSVYIVDLGTRAGSRKESDRRD